MVNRSDIEAAHARSLFGNHPPLNDGAEPNLFGHLSAFNRFGIQPGIGNGNRALAGDQPGDTDGILIKPGPAPGCRAAIHRSADL